MPSKRKKMGTFNYGFKLISGGLMSCDDGYGKFILKNR